MKHLSDAPFKGWLLAIPTNIRPGWKGLPLRNALAYYEKSQLVAVKSFITLAPGVNVIKLFHLSMMLLRNKLERLSLASFVMLVYQLQVRPRTYSQRGLLRLAPSLLTNIRLA